MKKSLEYVKEKPSKNWWPALLYYFLFAVLGAALVSPFTTWISPDKGIVEQIGGLYTFAGSTFLAIAYTLWIKKRSIRALGFKKENCLGQYGLGLILGLGMACCVIGTASLFSGFSFASQDSVDWLWILVAALGFFIQGLTEEVLTRGYLFNELASHLSRVWATLISALAFMGLHAANPGMTLMPVINLFVFGLVFALLFWLTDNIWLVGAAHSIWNFTLGPLLGIEVSGQVFPKTIFISQARADLPLINGGSFGVEASIFTTFFGLLACLYMVCLLRKRGEN
ncbi:CPBP family intramembrane glutamic endopeptidase [Streptococcus oricebi]|uniref:CAAX prenyl protease 2/Lysostaphin resistance protein A-like domain-containing protein n=1 Tax=Streptococcus oricebi TaxID=1547447 RepID=A0ABS5B3U2_9STRE|nr:hypothetical protein [Streptococcus oricebi]